MKKGWLRGFLILGTIAFISCAGLSIAANSASQGRRSVLAGVERINNNGVSVKTEEGAIRYFTIGDAAENGVDLINSGEEASLEIDDEDQIANIREPQHYVWLLPTAGDLHPSDKSGVYPRQSVYPLSDGGSRSIAPEANLEAERLFKNNLSRFQRSDGHGGVLFSFYRDHVDRSVAGEEGAIIHSRIGSGSEKGNDRSTNEKDSVP